MDTAKRQRENDLLRQWAWAFFKPVIIGWSAFAIVAAVMYFLVNAL